MFFFAYKPISTFLFHRFNIPPPYVCSLLLAPTTLIRNSQFVSLGVVFVFTCKTFLDFKSLTCKEIVIIVIKLRHSLRHRNVFLSSCKIFTFQKKYVWLILSFALSVSIKLFLSVVNKKKMVLYLRLFGIPYVCVFCPFSLNFISYM